MLQLVVEICDNLRVLQGWRYSVQQCICARERRGKTSTAVSEGPGPVLLLDEKATEAPFMTALMYTLISLEFDIIRLSAILARARRGRWNQDPEGRTYFIPNSAAPRIPEVGWRTAADEDLGVVTVRMRGENITSKNFSAAWPSNIRYSGSHLSHKKI